MGPQPNFIVFQCYGNEAVFYECAYALLSLASLYKRDGDPALYWDDPPPVDLQVWIYTDNPEWFQLLNGISLSLNFRVVDPNIIWQWRGKIDFTHRVKIEVLKDFSKERNGNVLYVDTDVVFIQKIDKLLHDLGEAKLYMHVMEGIVSEKGNHMLAKLNDYLQEYVPLKVNGKPIQDLAMWNAGVIGFNTKYRYLLNDVLAFTDSEYPRFQKHIMEQFAFSVNFQQTADIKTAAPYIVHYWNLKEARKVLASFFAYFGNKGIEEMMRCAPLIQVHVLMQEKMNFMHNRSILDKLLKKEWQPALHDWKELIKTIA